MIIDPGDATNSTINGVKRGVIIVTMILLSVFAAVALGFLFYTTKNLLAKLHTVSMSCVLGSVTDVKQRSNSNRFGSHYSFLQVQFCYHVNAEPYNNTCIVTDRSDFGFFEQRPNVNVYYDPAHPSISVLSKGPSIEDYASVLVMVIVIIGLTVQLRHCLAELQKLEARPV